MSGRTQRERQRLSEQIDAAVEGEVSADLLGRLVKQSLELRYYDSDSARLVSLINQAVDAKVREMIAFWLKEWDDSLWEGVKERLEGIHLAALATQITDEFMAAVANGERP